MTAARYGVERMVNISTDKAVEPVNVMGATKRAGELIIRMIAARNPDTLFASVRFGNVLGSRGSVIPIFKSQIENGGPRGDHTPGHDPLLHAYRRGGAARHPGGDHDRSGEYHSERNLNTFVLEMGEPVPIIELAQRMIDFYWQEQSKSIGVEFSGLRPGEKLDEHLVYPHEEAVTSSHPLVKRVFARYDGAPEDDADDSFERRVFALIALARDHGDKHAIIEGLMECVPGYTPLRKVSVEEPAALV